MKKIKVFESEDAIRKCEQYENCHNCPYSSFPLNPKYKPKCQLADVEIDTYEEDDEGMDWFL